MITVVAFKHLYFVKGFKHWYELIVHFVLRNTVVKVGAKFAPALEFQALAALFRTHRNHFNRFENKIINL